MKLCFEVDFWYLRKFPPINNAAPITSDFLLDVLKTLQWQAITLWFDMNVYWQNAGRNFIRKGEDVRICFGRSWR